MLLNRLFLILFVTLLSVVWLPMFVVFRLLYGRSALPMVGVKLKEWKRGHLKRKSGSCGFQRLSWPRRKFRRLCAWFIVSMKQEIEIMKAKHKQQVNRKMQQLRRALEVSPRGY